MHNIVSQKDQRDDWGRRAVLVPCVVCVLTSRTDNNVPLQWLKMSDAPLPIFTTVLINNGPLPASASLTEHLVLYTGLESALINQGRQLFKSSTFKCNFYFVLQMALSSANYNRRALLMFCWYIPLLMKLHYITAAEESYFFESDKI